MLTEDEINQNNSPNSPIEFRDHVEYDGKVFLEITDKEIPGITPGKYYMNQDSEVYSKNKGGGIKKSRQDQRYLANEYRLADGGRRHAVSHKVNALIYNRCENCDELEVNHIDGNRKNNNISNLEFVTHKENMDHAYRTGLNQNYCENNASAYLTNEQVHEICKILESDPNIKYTELSAKFNCLPVVIVRIATGRAWNRISSQYNLPGPKNSRFTDEQVHAMCKIFVELKGKDFSDVYNEVVRRLGLDKTLAMRHKIHSIYFKRKSYFTRISDQYDYY